MRRGRVPGIASVALLARIESTVRSLIRSGAIKKEEMDAKRIELAKAVLDLPLDAASEIMKRLKMTPGRPVADVAEEVRKGKPGPRRAPWSVSRPFHDAEHRTVDAFVRLYGSWRPIGWWCLTESGFIPMRGYRRGLPSSMANWKPRGKGPFHPCPRKRGRDARVLRLYVHGKGRGATNKVVASWCPRCGGLVPAKLPSRFL